MSGDPEGQSQETQKRQPPKTRSVIVRIFRALKRYENRRSRRAKSQHQVNERMMARWTRHVGLFTGALVAVGIVTAVIFLRQLNVMQGQLDEMKVEQRPWVYADSPRLTDVIRINEAGVWTLPLKFGVYNVGHLPGQYTHTPVVAAIATTMDEIFAIQRKYCAVEPGYTGATVFPGQNLTKTPGTGVLTPENRLLGISTKAPSLVEFKIVGCVIYQFPTGNEQHRSRFVYDVTLKQRGRPFFPDDFSEIPIDQVTIDPLERADAFKAD